MKWPMTGGQDFSLSNCKEKTILYFYPRDNTSGCSQEAADFAAAYKKFQKLGVEIFGVSGDSLASHEKFQAKLSLPFELVSDPEFSLCEKFGVMKMKNMYGKKFRGIERSTFVLGKKGKILREWRGLRVPGHVAEVLAFLQEG